MRKMIKLSVILTLLLINVMGVQAQSPLVRAVLFYTPACSHCHAVMTEVLPPLREQYGDRLYIAEIDTTQLRGAELFQTSIDKYVHELEGGVPTLIIGDNVLIGSQEIPEQLPGLIEQYLAVGGIDWPDLPDIAAIIGEYTLSDVGEKVTLQELFGRDPVGNGISVGVLVLLAVALISVMAPHRWQTVLADKVLPVGFWIVLIVGLVAAGYLSYVEVTQSEAVCGPVGDCNAVQQSEYAKILGFLPVGVFGLLGYLALLASFLSVNWIKNEWAKYAPFATFVMAAFGLSFSIYLTFLEPFVIGATCAWCLVSAICMMLLTLFTAAPGWAGWKAWQDDAWRRSASRHKRRKRY